MAGQPRAGADSACGDEHECAAAQRESLDRQRQHDMNIHRIVLAIGVPCVLAGSCQSRDSSAEWTLPSTESFIIRSSVTNHDYQIMVALPRGYDDSTRTYPVLYVLDANGMFPIAVEAARFLEFDRPKEVPVIVGVGYPVGLYWNTLAPRIRDFTPTADAEWVDELSKRLQFSSQGSGGAAAFLEFVAKDMLPVVEARYRLDNRRRALHGYSMGGLFAVYTLLHASELFESYLIGAPGLDWDGGLVWTLEREYAHMHKDLRARIFLTAGRLDERNVPDVQKLAELVRSRQYPSLVLRTEVFDNETHNSAIPLTLSRGIRWLYGDLAPGS